MLDLKNNDSNRSPDTSEESKGSACGLPPSVQKRIADEALRVKEVLGSNRERRVLIIGGAGYIGGPLTTALLRAGYKVRNLDLFTYGHQSAMLGVLPHADYEFQYGDLGQADVMNRALDGVTDVIILGGLVGDPITKKYPEESHAINDIGIRNCIDRLNHKGLNKVIFVSTCSNYGLIEKDVLANEEYDLNPLSLYAKSKVAAEQYLLSLKGETDYHATILRFATAFGLGSRMRFDLTVNEFTRDLYLDKELLVYDAGTWRPYCHVNDFASLMSRVLAFPIEDVSFEVFNAGTESNNHTKQNIVDTICEYLPDRKIDYKDNSDDPRNYKVSFEKLREILFFEPKYSVRDGIKEIIWAMKSHLFDDYDSRKNYYGNYKLMYDARENHKALI